jgi:hypothetical protein
MLKDDYSARLLCETLGVHRCNLDHEPRPDEEEKRGIVDWRRLEFPVDDN